MAILPAGQITNLSQTGIRQEEVVQKGVPTYTRDTTRTDVPQLPSATVYGEGPAWVDGYLWRSDGDAWMMDSPGIVRGESITDRQTTFDCKILDMNDMRPAHALREFTLPSPYLAVGDEVVHPCFVFQPNGWNGYRYWAVFTPYPSANSFYENPCIAVSQNGYDWEVPLGLTNPVQEPVADASSYYADTHLYLTPDRKKMIMVYNQKGNFGGIGQNWLWMRESSDGVNWTDKREITHSATGQHYASPSIFWDHVRNKWTIVFHQTDSGATQWQVQTITADTLNGPWSAPVALTITPAAGRKWWHSWFGMLQSGQVVCAIQDNSGVAGGSGEIYLGSSYDMSTFTVSKIYSGLNTWYRPALIINSEQDEIDIVLNRSSSGKFWRTRLVEGAVEHYANYMRNFTDRVAGTYPTIFRDTFNRADNAGTPGTSDSGTVWTVSTGTQGIISNAFYGVTVGNSRGYIELSVPDFRIQTKISTWGAQQTFIMFRYVDISNYWRFGKLSSGSTAYGLQTVISNAVTTLDIELSHVVCTDGDVIDIACHGALIRISVNGRPVIEMLSGQFQTATKAGLQLSNNIGRVDSFIVTT